mgnify:CR=1 FL=1
MENNINKCVTLKTNNHEKLYDTWVVTGDKEEVLLEITIEQ